MAHCRRAGGATLKATDTVAMLPEGYRDKLKLNPENLFVATVASAHMLPWLHVAFQMVIEVESYRDPAAGVLTELSEGVYWVSEVILNPTITLWNTVNLERSVDALRARGPVDQALMRHLSPLGWEHIHLTGDYGWQANRRVAKGRFRPLRQSSRVRSGTCGGLTCINFRMVSGPRNRRYGSRSRLRPMRTTRRARTSSSCAATPTFGLVPWNSGKRNGTWRRGCANAHSPMPASTSTC